MVKVRQDLSGMNYGRLTVLHQSSNDYVKPNGKKEALWLCKCICGNITESTSYKLKSGAKQSCGCLKYETSVLNGLKTKNLIFNKHIVNCYDLETYEYGIGLTTNGYQFLFDKEDYDLIKDYCWYQDSNGYIVCSDKDLFIHRLIMHIDDSNIYVDHIQHNKYDNRKEKLRIVTASQNDMNKKMQSNNTSGNTGVYFHKPSKKWVGYIKINGKQIKKYANTKEEAINKRIELENQYFKDYSYNNSMKGAMNG